MKRFFTYISLLLISGMLVTSMGENRGRHNMSRSEDRPRTSQGRPGNNGHHNKDGRPGNMGRPDNGDHKRPDNNGHRPGNGGHDRPAPPSANRPGHGNHNGFDRPGNNRPTPPHNNNYRPGNHKPDYKPGHKPDHRPGHNPGYRPTPPPPQAHRPHPRPPYRPPYRPYAPAYRPWARPVPPPSFRPYYGAPRISTILGIALGATIDASLSYLMNGGYSVAGYGSNIIYLNNVNQYNFSWPTSQLHYVNGALAGAELVYSSRVYDMSRYNMLYNSFVSQYGYPVSVQNNGGGNVSSTWWGYNNGYITLSYFGDYANDGSYRYYTTMNYGN